MKSLNEYLSMNYRMKLVEDKDEGGYIVSFPELPGCLSSGDAVESAYKNAINAKMEWIESAYEEGIQIPEH